MKCRLVASYVITKEIFPFISHIDLRIITERTCRFGLALAILDCILNAQMMPKLVHERLIHL